MNTQEKYDTLPEPVFRKAVVAAGFTPHLQAVLNETHRLLKTLGTFPIIVHVGEDTPANRNRLEEAIQRSNFQSHPPIFLIRSGSAPEVLMQVALEYHADLICAGAVKKEGLFKYYLGSVARNLARNAPCSVMLFTEPHIKPEPLVRIHCIVEYEQEAELAVQVAANLAYFGGKELFLTHSFFIPEWEDKKQIEGETDKIKKIYKKQDQQLQSYLEQFDLSGLAVRRQSIYDKNQSATLNFTREIGADLIVVPALSNRSSLWDRLFPHDLELTLQNLPCSMLLARKSTT